MTTTVMRPHRTGLAGLLVVALLFIVFLLGAQTVAVLDASLPDDVRKLGEQRLAEMMALPLPWGGQAQVQDNAQHLAKHQEGSYTASQIKQDVLHQCYDVYYSLGRNQFLFVVERGGECGGLVVGFRPNSGTAFLRTAFGGSQIAEMSSCHYWRVYIVQRDHYVHLGKRCY